MAFADATWVQAFSFLGAGLAIGFGAVSVALGEGYAAGHASQSLARRPDAYNAILKNMLIGQAVAESAGIFALVIAMMLIFLPVEGKPLVEGFAYLGAGLAMGLAALGSGLGSGFPAAQAVEGISLNPEVQGPLATNMLIGSALCQTPSIFGMVVAFMLLFLDHSGSPTSPTWAALLGAGLCMGLSAIGSGLGSGLPAGTATEGIARQPEATSALRTNMLVGSAVGQTPAIFGMVVSFMLLFVGWGKTPADPGWAYLLSAALATGLSAIGPGLGNGFAAAEAAAGIARVPDTSGQVTTSMLIGQTVSQSTVIYGFLVSLILLFVTIPDVADPSLTAVVIPLSAGLCMGFGGIGPGVGEGITAAYTVRWIARNQEHGATLTRIMLVGQAVAESTGIYSLIVALVLMFVVK